MNSRQHTISKGGNEAQKRTRYVPSHNKDKQRQKKEEKEESKIKQKSSHNLDNNKNNSSIITTKHQQHSVEYFLIIDQNKDTQH